MSFGENTNWSNFALRNIEQWRYNKKRFYVKQNFYGLKEIQQYGKYI